MAREVTGSDQGRMGGERCAGTGRHIVATGFGAVNRHRRNIHRVAAAVPVRLYLEPCHPPRKRHIALENRPRYRDTTQFHEGRTDCR
jgi:hypothetical protein